jgi:hypothetical protein
MGYICKQGQGGDSMSTLSLKNIFHAGDFTSRIDEVVFIILSMLIFIPLVFFLYGVFCMIMLLVENIWIL